MTTCNCSPYGNFRTRTFANIYGSAEKFVSTLENSGIPLNIKKATATTLFYLLYARFGNSHIASMDENQFQYKVASTVFMYGPTWEKRLDIQEKLRNLTLEQIKKGGGAIYNTAKAPGTEMAGLVNAEGKVDFIDGQNTTAYLRSDMEAYSTLIALLETDVTKEFIDRFQNLFLKIVEPYEPLWYETEV